MKTEAKKKNPAHIGEMKVCTYFILVSLTQYITQMKYMMYLPKV